MTCLRSRVPRKGASPASTPRPGRRLAAGRGHVLRPPRFLLSSLQKSLKSPPYAHTSAEHGSDRSKFKGRCGGGSSDGIRGQATLSVVRVFETTGWVKQGRLWLI